MLLAAFLILLLLSITLVYQYLIVPRTAAAEGFETQTQKSLVFLYMNGCGWCEKFKPEWDQFSATYGASLAAKGVAVVSYERSDPKSSEYNDYVQGYPTVLLVSSSSDVIVFKGERTSKGLVEFLKENGIGM
jgi:thiol-disulfide isomerase/thioredoxin